MSDSFITRKNTRTRNRRGSILGATTCVLFLLSFGLLFFAGPIWRAVDIARIVNGSDRYDSEIAAFAFVMVLVFMVGFFSCCPTRKRYTPLFHFPLYCGIPLGFTAAPFHLPLYVYFPILVVSTFITTSFFFLVQAIFIHSELGFKKKGPIPDEIPALPKHTKPERKVPTANLEELPADPNSWKEYGESAQIYYDNAIESYIFDNDIDEFRSLFSIYCQIDLLIYRRERKYFPFWCNNFETHYFERIVQPCAALDFQGARDREKYVQETLPEIAYRISRREEQIIRGICAAIMKDEKELELVASELKKSNGLLDYLLFAGSPRAKYWLTFLEGLAERNVQRCYEAIRIQAEQWYTPTVFDFSRLNITGVAMSNLCRWYGVNVPALEPVVPEELLLHENSDSGNLLPLHENE